MKSTDRRKKEPEVEYTDNQHIFYSCWHSCMLFLKGVITYEEYSAVLKVFDNKIKK